MSALTKSELRAIRKASATLREWADSIRESHTDNHGDWGDELRAKKWHDDVLAQADRMREVARQHRIA